MIICSSDVYHMLDSTRYIQTTGFSIFVIIIGKFSYWIERLRVSLFHSFKTHLILFYYYGNKPLKM